MSIYSFFFLMMPPPPRSTLFPYTTLFRSMKGLAAFSFPHHPTGSLGLRTRPVEVWLWGDHDTSAASLDRKSTRLNSSHVSKSYAVFCLKKKRSNYRQLFVNGRIRAEILYR